PTVLSRCLQFNLRPMAPETVQEHLAQVLQAEGVPYEEAALAVLGRAARGSMRDALSLTDQALAYGQGRLEAAGVRAMIGLVDDDHAVGWLQALAARDADAVMQSLQSLRDSGQSAAAAVDAMAQALQSIALEQMLPGSLVNPDDEPWRELASRWDPQEVQLLYAMLLAARTELGLAPDEHAALLMVAWRYFSFVKGPSEAAPARPAPQALVGGTQRPARTEVRPAVPVPPVRSVLEPAHEASDGAAMERWCTWIAALVQAQSVSALVRELGLQAQCVSIDDAAQRLVLKVRSESLASEALAAKLAEALNRHTGQTWVLQVSQGDVGDSLALRETRRRDRRQAQAEAMIRQDPLVQDLLAQFPGAQLVPGSVRPVEPTS
ncbi:MAG: DNA polymerase III subunit gamma/tau C-terminal domain-containing protein, partial [Betaproteobacteria bacterium]